MPAIRLLRLGDENPSVWVLETKLRQLGFFKGMPNEVFDRETETAVREFQRFAGLVDDGIAGEKTFRALYGGPVAKAATKALILSPAVKTGGYWIAAFLAGAGLVWLALRKRKRR